MAVPKPSVSVRQARAGNYTPGRSLPISRITFHHIVGDANGALARFEDTSDGVSSNYVIGSNGATFQCVADNDTPHTDANWDSNQRAITIEHAGGHPAVPYTAQMYEASARLVAYLINHYGISDFKRHRDVSRTPTACPDGLDVESIIARARQIIEEANRPVPAPVPKPNLAITDIPNKKVRLIRDCNLWNLDFNSYPEAKAVKGYPAGTIIDVSATAKHPLGSTYYLSEYSFNKGIHNGFNVKDCEDYVEPKPTPAPTPTPLPQPVPGTPEPDRAAIIAFLTMLRDLITGFLGKFK